MRSAFIESLTTLARSDPSLWLLTADIGFSVLEPFAKEFPSRFLNIGVAEANMTGIAAGLAIGGKRVFTYSIANFSTLRCLEHIRNDICYHNLNVTIVAVGGGLAYGSAGYSHHGFEDIAIMRALPNIQIFSPSDPHETRSLIHHPGPSYLRLGKAGEPQLHSEPLSYGKAITLRVGKRAAILATGSILKLALEVADEMDATVLSIPYLKPFDEEALLNLRHLPLILTLEEHGSGGLASIVSETLALHSYSGRFRPFYIKSAPSPICGSQNYLRSIYGLTREGLLSSLSD